MQSIYICGAANESIYTHCSSCVQSLIDATRNAAIQDKTLLHTRYRLVEVISSGGFSVVYRAKDTQRKRDVAIKQVNLQGLSAAEKIEATDTFSREVNLLSTLTHPQIPHIYHHFSDQDHWYLVLEYIKGQTLETFLTTRKVKQQPFQLEELLTIVLQLCQILQYLHHRHPPVVYHDLKLDNIMYDAQGTIYLIDFGIARRYQSGHTRDTQRLGSPGYAAPEQYGLAQTTPRSDIYSLGALLHFLLSGQDPADDTQSLPPLQLPHQSIQTQLTALTAAMLSPDPARRPPTIWHVANALDSIGQQARIIDRAMIWPPFLLQLGNFLQYNQFHPQSARPTTRRKFLTRVGAGVLTAGLLGGGIYAGVQSLLNPSDNDNDKAHAHIKYHGPVYGLAWLLYSSVDSKTSYIYLASASADKTVQVVDMDFDPDVYGSYPPVSYTYTGHKDVVNSVAWSPDGTKIASASRDRTVQIIQIVVSSSDSIITYTGNTVTGGDLVLTYRGHQNAVNSVAWSPDGTKIVSASSDGTVQVWNTQTGKTIISKDQRGIIATAAWSPDGKFIASGGSQKAVQVWNASDGRTIATYQGHRGAISSVAWSLDGKKIASASTDGTVQVWNALNGDHILTYKGHKGAVNSIAWSPDPYASDTYIASASSDGSVQIWSVTDASRVYTYLGHKAAVNVVSWADFNFGKTLASGSDDNTVLVWNMPY